VRATYKSGPARHVWSSSLTDWAGPSACRRTSRARRSDGRPNLLIRPLARPAVEKDHVGLEPSPCARSESEPPPSRSRVAAGRCPGRRHGIAAHVPPEARPARAGWHGFRPLRLQDLEHVQGVVSARSPAFANSSRRKMALRRRARRTDGMSPVSAKQPSRAVAGRARFGPARPARAGLGQVQGEEPVRNARAHRLRSSAWSPPAAPRESPPPRRAEQRPLLVEGEGMPARPNARPTAWLSLLLKVSTKTSRGEPTRAVGPAAQAQATDGSKSRRSSCTMLAEALFAARACEPKACRFRGKEPPPAWPRASGLEQAVRAAAVTGEP